MLVDTLQGVDWQLLLFWVDTHECLRIHSHFLVLMHINPQDSNCIVFAAWTGNPNYFCLYDTASVYWSKLTSGPMLHDVTGARKSLRLILNGHCFSCSQNCPDYCVLQD